MSPIFMWDLIKEQSECGTNSSENCMNVEQIVQRIVMTTRGTKNTAYDTNLARQDVSKG